APQVVRCCYCLVSVSPAHRRSTALNLNKGANVLASQSFVSDGPVNISDATLSLNSRPDEVTHTLLPVYDYAGSWNLKGDDARLN
ncbi:hypothetical protein O5853_30810, partial [Escherichia coli]|nr:hypothetical protein [Escherichia coli]